MFVRWIKPRWVDSHWLLCATLCGEQHTDAHRHTRRHTDTLAGTQTDRIRFSINRVNLNGPHLLGDDFLGSYHEALYFPRMSESPASMITITETWKNLPQAVPRALLLPL